MMNMRMNDEFGYPEQNDRCDPNVREFASGSAKILDELQKLNANPEKYLGKSELFGAWWARSWLLPIVSCHIGNVAGPSISEFPTARQAANEILRKGVPLRPLSTVDNNWTNWTPQPVSLAPAVA